MLQFQITAPIAAAYPLPDIMVVVGTDNGTLATSSYGAYRNIADAALVQSTMPAAKGSRLYAVQPTLERSTDKITGKISTYIRFLGLQNRGSQLSSSINFTYPTPPVAWSLNKGFDSVAIFTNSTDAIAVQNMCHIGILQPVGQLAIV